MNRNELKNLIGCIIDIFEDFLTEKDIMIPNPEREDDENLDPETAAIIFGSDFDSIADRIEHTLSNYTITEAHSPAELVGAISDEKLTALIDETNRRSRMLYHAKQMRSLMPKQSANTVDPIKDVIKAANPNTQDAHITRAVNGLRRYGVQTLNDVRKLSLDELLAIPNIGQLGAKLIKNALDKTTP